MAKLFGDAGAYFFNNWVSNDDAIMGKRPGTEHSHLYGSSTDQSQSTGVYFPDGGAIVSPNTRVPGSKYLGSSRNGDGTHNANYVLIQFDRRGKKNDMTLAIFHIDNFAITEQADGQTKVGDIGFTSDANYGSGGALAVNTSGMGGRSIQTKSGGHSHLVLMRGLRWNLGGKQIPIQSLCPPN